MSRHIGLDLSPFALRAFACEEDGCSTVFSPVYSPKGCVASEEYQSRDRWDDPLSFRTRTLGRWFEINHVEQTVSYLKPDASNTGWLEAYAQRIAAEAGGTYGSRLVATVSDHTTPDEKDAVIRGLSNGGFGRPLLLWRPIAAALYWLQRQADADSLVGRRLVILDLDGSAPEVTELELVRHEARPEFVVPVRAQPRRHQILKSKGFHARCYQLVMSGFEDSIQLVEGQFSADVQAKLEQGERSIYAWVRRDAAWTRVPVELAADLPEGAFAGLEKILKNIRQGEGVQVLCVGWLARRYAKQAADWLKMRLASAVEILPAEAISSGAARFGELLSKDLPTYYDKLPCYRWWDSRKAEWIELFGQYQRVEPGRDYLFPAAGSEPCILSIDKFNDNVSMYVQVKTEDDKYEEDDVYAHRLKIHFGEFLRTQLKVSLTARVNPQEGSASFTITAEDPQNRIFKEGNTRSRSATLRYSEDPDADSHSSVQIVHEHEGYLEPQPVLGRIYDSADYVRMVELYVNDRSSDECRRLKSRYFKECNGPDKFLSGRIGYDKSGRRYHQPTRGLFGSVRIPEARIDSISSKFAEHEGAHYWYCGHHSYDWYTAQNYCFGWATREYKTYIRKMLVESLKPEAYSAYYSPAYVLGDDPNDLELVLQYHNANSFKFDVRENLWWGIFRMLCWHPEVKFAEVHRGLVEKFFGRVKKSCEVAINRGKRFSELGKQSLLLTVLYLMRFRETGLLFSPDFEATVVDLIEKYFDGVPFPKTMINNMNGSRQRPGDNLTRYVLRFVKRQDDLRDRELGAAMGGV